MSRGGIVLVVPLLYARPSNVKCTSAGDLHCSNAIVGHY